MKYLLTFISISLIYISLAQEDKPENPSLITTKSNIELGQIASINNKFITAWSIDQLNHIYIANGSTIIKYNSNGEILFSQSIKSIGEISSIDVLNPMKICLFSKNQQKICFIDNTLTLINECISLSNENIGYISNICASNRQNKIWMWDSNNSKLLQIDNINLSRTISESTNLDGIINLNNPIFFTEMDNHLHIIDENRKLHLFDIFGTLIDNEYNINNEAIVASYKNQLWTLNDESIFLYKEQYDKIFFCKLPKIKPVSFEVNSNFFYIETITGIHILKVK